MFVEITQIGLKIDLRDFFEPRSHCSIRTSGLHNMDCSPNEKAEDEAARRAVSLGLSAPTFVDAERRRVVGISQRYTRETRKEIPQQWDRFCEDWERLASSEAADSFGVSWNANRSGFDYLVGVEAGDPTRIPTGYEVVTLPAGRYAVFPHRLHVTQIAPAFDTIWDRWVPECGLDMDESAPCFERYTAEFKSDAPGCGIELWIPLRISP